MRWIASDVIIDHKIVLVASAAPFVKQLALCERKNLIHPLRDLRGLKREQHEK